MPSFHYKALDPSGKSITGTLEAADRKQVLRKLHTMSVRPLSINELKGNKKLRSSGESSVASSDGAPQKAQDDSTTISRRWSLPSFKSKENVGLSFLKRLLDLHSSGMPLGDSVRLLNQRLSDPKLKFLAQSLWRELSEGRTLADSMRTLPQYFNNSITYVIEAGEATGRLVPILQRIVAHLEEKQDIKSSLLRGISYPFFLVGAALCVAAYLVFSLLPKVRGILQSLGGEINWAMTVLMSGSNFIFTFGPFLALAAVVLIVGFFQWRKTAGGRLTSDQWILRIPLFGKIFYYSELFQLTSLIGTLVGSDINMTESLRLSERTIQNRSIRASFRTARTQINEGLSLSQAFKRNHIMPPLSLDILAVGENTGNIANGLGEISQSFRRELDARLRLMTTTITTGAMVIAFLLVALVAFGMVSSIFQVSKSL